jgi:histidinol-phosphate aminotransferase
MLTPLISLKEHVMSVINSALMQVKQLHPYTPGKPVEELERELGIAGVIKLASNENPLGCSPKVKQAISQASQNIELYPDANAFYLKQALAHKLQLKKNQITIGNGSNDILDLVARTFLDADAEAIYSEHAFLVYALVTQACGAKAQIAPALGAGSEQNYGHDLDAMFALINKKTRLIFIANPNNPTGTWINADRLKSFIESVPEHIAIVVDEAYFEYVDHREYPDALKFLDAHPNLIVTRTFSKIYGLAGLRLGYSISSAELCDLFNRIRQPFNGNSIALAAACAALDDDQFVEKSRDNNQQGLVQMQTWFDHKEIEYIPSVGNFLTVRFGQNAQEIYQNMLQHGVIVRPVANYKLPEFLRISVGTPSQIERMFDVLETIL